MSQEGKEKIYKMFTDKFIESVEKTGELPWEKSWMLSDMPHKYHGKNYRGMNVPWLMAVQREKGYKSSVWVSFKDAKDNGGRIKKGEKASPVVLFKPVKKMIEQDDGTFKPRTFWLFRYYNVFNCEQTEGFDFTDKTREVEEIQKPKEVTDKYIKREKLEVIYGNPAYVPGQDTLRMPKVSEFKNAGEYHVAMFHEMVHSTGHEKRLKRDLKGRFDLESYSKEELIAEMGSAFLGGITGIEKTPMKNHVAYVKGWLKELANDPKLLVCASSKAQTAVDFVLTGKKPADKDDEE